MTSLSVFPYDCLPWRVIYFVRYITFKGGGGWGFWPISSKKLTLRWYKFSHKLFWPFKYHSKITRKYNPSFHLAASTNLIIICNQYYESLYELRFNAFNLFYMFAKEMSLYKYMLERPRLNTWIIQQCFSQE